MDITINSSFLIMGGLALHKDKYSYILISYKDINSAITFSNLSRQVLLVQCINVLKLTIGYVISTCVQFWFCSLSCTFFATNQSGKKILKKNLAKLDITINILGKGSTGK